LPGVLAQGMNQVVLASRARTDCPATAATQRRAPQHDGWWETVALAALASLLLFPGLGGYPLLDPSEGRPATIAREMALRESWLVPVLHGERYSDKPAPFYWLLRATALLPLPPEAAARLPSVLATLATVVLLHRFARPRLGASGSFLGGVVYLTSPAVVGLGRFATQDALLTAFVTASITAWLRWIEQPSRAPWLAYALMGVGAMVKGPVAIVLPLLAAGACASSRGALRSRLAEADLLRGLALSAAILLIWLAPAAIADPIYAWKLFVDHHLRRYLTGGVGHPRPPWSLVPDLAAVLLPWCLTVPALVGLRATRGDRGGSTAALRERDLLLWAGVIVAFFSLGRAKLATYVLPAVPPLALWIGTRLVTLAGELPTANRPGGGTPAASREARRRLLSMRVALAAWATTLALAPAVVWLYLRREFPMLVPWAALALPLPAIAALGLVAAWREPRRLRAVPLVFASGNVALALLGYLAGAPVVGRVASDAQIARTAAEIAPGVPIVGFRVQPSSLAFYASSPVRKLKDVDAVLQMAGRGPLLLVTRERGAAELRRAGLTLHPWIECVRHCLYGTVPRPAPRLGADR
jgi:4-amino-4-deoxy-L-arabinose transferase-like glycosyltransferase